MQRRRMRLSVLAPLFALCLGCASSPPPEPRGEPEAPAAGEEPAAAEPAPEPDPAAAAPRADGPKTTGDAPPSRPNSYEITNRDCDALGDRLAEVTRSDQSAEISPRLSKAQRDQTEAANAEVSRKVGERWAESCRRSLVGGYTDEGSLKCAMRARSVKAFDECLNGTPVKP
jgi:hypothetical protein